MRLLPAMSEALDLPEDYFTQRFTPSQFSVRFAHYPRYEGDDDAIGIAPHSDSNFLTFLPQSELPGLQVKTQDGRWIDLPRVKGSIAVNSGVSCGAGPTGGLSQRRTAHSRLDKSA